MTVTAKETWIQYTGTGAVDTYPYDWKILAEDDLSVIRTTDAGVDTTLALNTDYTVTDAGEPSGGNVVLSAVLTSGYKLTIYSNMAVEQPTDFTNQDAFFLEAVESALDRQCMISRQLATALDRCVQLPATSGSTGDELGDLLLAVEDYTDRAEAAAISAEADAATASAAVGRLTYTETVSGTSKTAFDLPFNYDHTDSAITVFIDGVYQHPDSYTCTDANTVTMDDAVDVGQVVTFMSSTLGTPDLGTNFADPTLSNLSNAATARGNLGLGELATMDEDELTLGTAAALDVGTSANNVVQLDSSAKLPAVDGSQLTNVSASSGWSQVGSATDFSGASLIELTGLSSGYDYLIEIDQLQSSTSLELRGLLGYGAGPSYVTSGYAGNNVLGTGGGVVCADTNTARLDIIHASYPMSSGAPYGFLSIVIRDTSARRAMVQVDGFYKGAYNYSVHGGFWVDMGSGNNTTAFKLTPVSGTITGRHRIYRRAR